MHSYLHFCHDLQNYPLVVWFTNAIVVSLVIWMAHYVSVFLTIGSMVMMNLRVLGIAGKNQTITQVADFYAPWMWIGLTVLFFTGILMLLGDSALFCTNTVFGVNLLITVLAAVSGVFVRKRAPAWEGPSGAPRGAKVIAGVSIFLWLGTILSAVAVPALSNVP
jgi:hypothetical protein